MEQLTLTAASSRAKFRLRWCAKHGPESRFRLDGKQYRCVLCATAAVAKSRTNYRRQLVDEHGGRCQRCGYDRYIGALEFHHRDPSTKEFEVSMGSGKSLTLMRVEAEKCDLLCSNCHREVEADYVG